MRTSIIVYAGAICAAAAFPQARLLGKTPLLFQERDDGTARPVTASELKELNDPFYRLVLCEHGSTTYLNDIEQLIQPNPTSRYVYVVSSNLPDPRRDIDGKPQRRRAVMTFGGSNAGVKLGDGLMLAVDFDSEHFGDTQPEIEAIALDISQPRYNFYRLDASGTDEHHLSWKFRGSSDDVDKLPASKRQGHCLACHVTGTPVMRELFLPWGQLMGT